MSSDVIMGSDWFLRFRAVIDYGDRSFSVNGSHVSGSVISFGRTPSERIQKTIVDNIIKDAGLRSMRVKYKEENSLYCQNCCDVSLAMGLPTSSGFIKLKKKKHQILKLSHTRKINIKLT